MAANLIAKQQEMERDKKLKEKEDLEAFVRRFSANASKAKQATSRQKRLEKLILPTSRLHHAGILASFFVWEEILEMKS